MITVEGKAGIKATVIAHSISIAGVPMITWEIEYPRLILAELNTHRMLSKNSSSSRAIPFSKMVTQLNGEPVRFGEANPGMQDTGEDYTQEVLLNRSAMVPTRFAWQRAKEAAIEFARSFYEAGYHKQVYNRLTEPYQMMKTVISGTEVANFFWLRDDDAADPTLRELARCMRESMEQSTPVLLKPGQWHLPYVDYFEEVVGYTTSDECIYGPKQYYIGKLQVSTGEVDPSFQVIALEEAVKVSCARCAAVSYRNEGYGLDKSLELYERLVGSDKKHASALEHCATPMKPHCYEPTVLQSFKPTNVPAFSGTWQDGISHIDRNNNMFSGNLRGYIQYRKLIIGECKWD